MLINYSKAFSNDLIEIWAPRWRDKTVLVAYFRVKPGINYLIFTKCPSMPYIYSFDGEEVLENAPIVSNGKKHGRNSEIRL